MRLRKIVSLTALISFVLILITSIILYIVPHGRIAYWADWHLFGLSKSQWGELHVNLGILFIITLGLHLYYNWQAVMAYLKNKKTKLIFFTANFNAALAITLVVVTGTYFMVPPFSSIIGFSQSIKDNAAIEYGQPPFGHAEQSSLKALTQKSQILLKDAKQRLDRAGIKVTSPDQIFLDIARKNNRSPRQLFEIISPDQGRYLKKKMPPTAPPGAGNKTLNAFCLEYEIDPELVIKIMAFKGLFLSPEQTLKQGAEHNHIPPQKLYKMIRKAALSQKL
ncbi:MAG: DUF4405 domain-containing protein [Desulfobacter sp.]|nr:MAG: DUF4405 domain-containing protein [Desulfobacter sp.]